MMARLGILLVLWLPFAIAGLFAAVITFFVILFGDKEKHWGYGKDVLRAMDKVLAAVCGFSGYFTFSAELGVDDRKWCRAIRWLLDLIQPGHCVEAARREGLLK